MGQIVIIDPQVNRRPKTLQILYAAHTTIRPNSESFKVKSLEAAIGIIRRRNVTNIKSATFGGKKIDLETLQKIYGHPKVFLEQYSLNDILKRFAPKKAW